MSYNSPFTGTVIQPTDVSYRAITLATNTQLEWPINGNATDDYAARIMDVTASSGGLSLYMPPANQTSVGNDALIRNVGANSFTVKTYNNNGTIITIAAGEAKYIYIKTNNDEYGTWGNIAFGVGTSAQGFGEFASSSEPVYIESCFSTYLYTGNGSVQTIPNGIDLSGKGGLVWTKCRGATARSHILIDTVRGASSYLSSNLTDAAATTSVYITGFNANGYGIDYGNAVNASPNTFASWTFRKQPKFFDVVTYTGNGTTQAISHNLGSVPGFIIIKKTNSAEDWWCFHRYDFTYRTKLNATNAAVNTTSAKYLGNNVIDVAPTSTTFTVGDTSGLNGSGDTFVAYLFAHNAGGFGLTGSDNVISCGSYTTDGSGNATINLGYEPQLVLGKLVSDVGDWAIVDNMRGWLANGGYADLNPNNSNVEDDFFADTFLPLTSTGFKAQYTSGNANKTYIYIAIRRGPMKTPTTGTSVLGLNARTGTGANATVTGGQTDDAVLIKNRGSAVASLFSSRLTGTGYLVTSSTAAEVAAGTTILQANPWDVMDGVKVGTTSTITNASASTYINYLFRRAPGFFDVVCYTGDGNASQELSHNLGVTPTLILTKMRNDVYDWLCYSSTTGTSNTLYLNLTNASTAYTIITSPTATKFTVNNLANNTGVTYVAYLFASCPGVSKVGTYTGTGTTLQVDCGFTGGARFVLIKRTDSTGGWYVWDSARGIVAGNDPYLLLNSTAAEVTSTDYVDTYSAGFEISSTAPSAINANGGTFIFLAIA